MRLIYVDAGPEIKGPNFVTKVKINAVDCYDQQVIHITDLQFLWLQISLSPPKNQTPALLLP